MRRSGYFEGIVDSSCTLAAQASGSVCDNLTPMYRRNPQFPEPGSNAVVWRYMPFAAFVDLLQRRQMFFTRLEKLADPYEGSYSAEIKAVLEWKVPKSVIKAAERFSRRNYCVSCWHENRGESAAMWAIYSSPDGIAIRTTVGRLKDAFHDERRRISISRVHYSSASAPIAAPLAQKRKSFEHEREVRVWCLEADRRNGQENGTYASVDLEVLIESVFVSPLAKPWITAVVQTTLDRHAVHVKAIQSELYSRTLV
jgi:hypothetical protein